MTIFLKEDGNVALCLPSTITQGSNNANKIVLIGPFDKSNVITVAFALQNGKTYGPRLVDPYTTEEIDLSSLKSDVYAMTPSDIPGYTVDGAILYAWTYTLNSVLSSCSGTLNIQFLITDADGATLSSQLIQATINSGIKNLTLPEPPAADVYDDIRAYLTNFNVDIDEIKKAKEYAEAASKSAYSAAGSANESQLYAHGCLAWNENGEPNWAFPDRWAGLGTDKLYSIMKETQNYPGIYSALYYAIDAAISKELAHRSATAADESKKAASDAATKAEKNASDIDDIYENPDNYPGSWCNVAVEQLQTDDETTVNNFIQEVIDSTANEGDPDSGNKKSALYYAIDANFSSLFAEIQKEKTETAKTAAVAAKNDAETAKTAAVAAKNDAETAKTDAVAAKTAAETAKTAAETAKDDAERTVRGFDSDTNAILNQAKNWADSSYTYSSQASSAAEQARESAENARATAEEIARSKPKYYLNLGDDGMIHLYYEESEV